MAERTSRRNYRGRFAPSPTGPLHFGSLAAALASFLQARAAGGEWLVRVEDIDPPREVPGAAEQILASLAAHGLTWDGDVVWQRRSHRLHTQLLERLVTAGHTFACRCSRQTIRAKARSGPLGPIYPGTCRDAALRDSAETSLRLRTDPVALHFRDVVQGNVHCQLADDIGDFVLRRRDGLFAYALAVVADDSAQAITEVVRGCDLLPFTPAQIHLQRLLGLVTPAYLHIPAAVDPHGAKLSKQTGARAIDETAPADNLCDGLEFLGQDPPAHLRRASPAAVLAWAVRRWDPRRIPRAPARPAPAHLIIESK